MGNVNQEGQTEEGPRPGMRTVSVEEDKEAESCQQNGDRARGMPHIFLKDVKSEIIKPVTRASER